MSNVDSSAEILNPNKIPLGSIQAKLSELGSH